MDPENCVICGIKGDDPINPVGEKGLRTIQYACEKKGESGLLQEIKNLSVKKSKIFVHEKCRKRLTDKRTIPIETLPPKRLRSSLDRVFNWKKDCFLCAKPCDGKKDNYKNVETIEKRKIVLEAALNRKDD